MKEQKLKRVTESDRRRIVLAVSQNRRSRKWQEAKLDSEFGPHTCGHCRAEPCGARWPHGACCHRCTHLPMPRWRLTHVLWYRKKPYYVMEVAARRPGESGGAEAAGFRRGGRSSDLDLAGSRRPEASAPLTDEQRYGVQRSPGGAAAATDAVYYRWDGVSQWVRRARTHYFLGVRVSPAEFLRSLPNEDELAEFLPRERPPHPFEASVVEQPEGELGDEFLDQTERDPEEADAGGRYEKRGLRMTDPDRTGSEDEDDDEG